MNHPGSVTLNRPHIDRGTDGPSSEPLVLEHYLFVLRKYLKPITLFTAVVCCLAAFYAFSVTPVYRASATLLLGEQTPNIVSIDELYGADSDDADYFATQLQLLQSRALAQRVITKLDLWHEPEFSDFDTGADTTVPKDTAPEDSVVLNLTSRLERLLDFLHNFENRPSATLPTPSDAVDPNVTTATDTLYSERFEEQVVSEFLERLNIAAVGATTLVRISYESRNPELATNIANTVGEQFIENFLDSRRELNNSASTWLSVRLGELKADLEAAEDRLVSFQRANDLVDIQGDVGRLNDQQLLLDTTELSRARNQLDSARSLYNSVQQLRGTPELLETIPAVQADALVQRTKIEQGNVQRALDELLTRYGDRHPRVLDAKSELASISATLNRHLNRVADTITKDFEIARERVASVESKISEARSGAQLLGDKRFELESLQREVDSKRRVYDQYFTRLTETASQEGLETANAQFADVARIPLDPVKPRKAVIIAAATIGALLLSVLIAFLRETLDKTIKGTREVETELGVELLGVLPKIKRSFLKRKSDSPLSPDTFKDHQGKFGEAVNTIRTALSIDESSTPPKVIVVTSSVRGEGKSTSSLHIAQSLGQLERVLLIDCDLRRPSIARALGLKKSGPGLTSLISRATTAQRCVSRGVLGPNVDILPSGRLPDQPLELLSSKRFARIVAEASKHYDRVVIDSAPIQAVSDALVLCQLADAVVYVVKSHETPIELARRGLERLRRVGAPIKGVLVSQVDLDKVKTYSGNYSYQGYHDSYGFYKDDKERKSSRSRMKLDSKEAISNLMDEQKLDLGFDSLNTQ